MGQWLTVGLVLAWGASAWGQIGEVPFDPLGLADRDPAAPAVDWGALAEAECPLIPSFALCTDEGWIASRCAEIDRRRDEPWCPRLVEAAQGRALAGLPEVSLVSADDEALDVPGRLEAFGVGNVTREGGGAASRLTGAFAEPIAGEASVQREVDRRHDGWTRNCSVQSCEEYVREAFYDYVVFEERAAALGDDWRAVFELVYSADGIANRTLERFRGREIGDLRLPARAYQNRFLSHQPWRAGLAVTLAEVVATGSLPAVPDDFFDRFGGACRYDPVLHRVDCRQDAAAEAQAGAAAINAELTPFDPELAAAIQPAQPSSYPPRDANPWDWHREQSDALGAVSDDRLFWLDDAQRAFIDRVREREAILADLDRWLLFLRLNIEDAANDGTEELVREQRLIVASLIARLKATDAEIQTGLAEAQGAGCLAPGVLTPCDWSPRWLADAVRGRYVQARAEAEVRCQQLTANNFNWLHAPEGETHWLTADATARGSFCRQGDDFVPGCVLRRSYVQDTPAVEQYFATIAAWLASLDFDRDPETGRTIVGRSASDLLKVGSGLFSVNFNFNGAWRVERVEGGAMRAGDDICANVFRTASAVNVDAEAFGFKASDLFSTGFDGLYRASVVTPPVGGPRAAAVVDLNVLGNAIYTSDLQVGDNGQNYQFNFVKAPSAQKSETESETFFVGAVPIKVDAGIAGQATLSVNARRRGTRCDPGTQAADFDGRDLTNVRIEPFVSASAFARASVGVPGASIGVRGDVTLVRLGFPLTVEGGYGDPEALSPDALVAEMVAAQTLTILSGSLSLVVEFVFGSASKRLFAWKGPSWTQEVFRDRLVGPLFVLAEAFGEGARRPQRPTAFDPGLQCEVPQPVPEAGLVYFDFDDEHVDAPARRLASAPFSPDRDDPQAALTWGEGGVQTSREGVHGQAFAVDGDARLSLALQNAPVINFTHALWVNPAAVGEGTLLSIGDDAGNARVNLSLDAGNRVVASTNCAGIWQAGQVSGEFALEAGRWHHVAVTYTRSEGRLRFFIDGRLLRTRGGCELNDLGNSQRLARSLPGRNSPPFAGLIDDYGRWDGIALTPAQVQTVAERGFDGRPLAGDGAAVPAGVVGLTAQAFDDRVALAWTNPPSLGQPGGFSAVTIRAAQAAAPRTLAQGVEVYRGPADQAIHAGLAVGQTWHYAAFALTADGQAQPGPTALATTVDAPPPPVQAFTAQGRVGHARLAWQVPQTPEFQRVVVRRHPTRFPAPGEGVVVYRGRANGVTDEVVEGGEWFYRAWAQDFVGNLSAPAQAQAQILVAEDLVPPPPPAILDLRATPGDGRVSLSWQVPDGARLDAVRVHRRVLDRPLLDTFDLAPDARALDDVGLVNGRALEYAVFAVGALGRLGPPAVVIVTPEVGERPEPPRGFRASAQGAAVTLTWADPADPTQRVVIRRSTQAPPQSLAQGVEVFTGRGGVAADPEPVAGRLYHYSAFTVTADARASVPVSVRARRQADAEPPPAVVDFQAAPGPERVALTWQPPAVPDLAAVRITLTAPGEDPVLLYEGRGDAALHAPAAPGVRYRYTAVAVDFAGNEGPPTAVEAEAEPPAGPVADAGGAQATLGGAWVWLDGSGSQAGPEATYSWRQTAGPAVTLVAGGPVARFLAPDEAGDATFELTVRDDAQVARATVDVRFDGPGVALPPETGAPAVPLGEFQVTLRADDAVVVAHEPQNLVAHIYDPEAGAQVGQFPIQAGRFIGVDAGRAGFLSDGASLLAVDLADPAQPRALEPFVVNVGFSGFVAMDQGRVVALNPRTGEVRVGDPGPDGWVARFDTTVPDGRSARHLVVVGDFAYLVIAGTEVLPEAVQALDISGDEPVWGAPEAVDGFSITRLVVADGALLALALPADPTAYRLIRLGLDDPTTPGPVQPLAGDFAQPDFSNPPLAVAGQLFATGLARPGMVDAVRLEADAAVPGAGFTGPGLPGGSFALWPAGAPTQLWVAAEGNGAAPGVATAYRLDVPRGGWWPMGAQDRAPAAVAADGDRVLAAGRMGVGGYGVEGGAVVERGFLAFDPPLEADPLLLLVNGAGGLLAERVGFGDAQIRRIGVFQGRPTTLSDPVALPFEPQGGWALDGQHVLLDMGFMGFQVFDLSGAVPAPVGDAFGQNGQLGAYDPAAQELLVWLGESTEFLRFDLSDPAAPQALPGGQFLRPPNPDFFSPLLLLNARPDAASYHAGVLRVVSEGTVYTLRVAEVVDDAEQAPAPISGPALLAVRPELSAWAVVGSGTLRWWDAPGGEPAAQAVGALTLPAPTVPENGGAFGGFGAGPYRWALAGDRAWIAAGRGGLLTLPLAPIRLTAEPGPRQAGDSARWRVQWAPGVGVAPTCAVSAGACELEAVDLGAGAATVRWDLADPGAATLRVRVGHSAAWRVGEVRVNVEAAR